MDMPANWRTVVTEPTTADGPSMDTSAAPQPPAAWRRLFVAAPELNPAADAGDALTKLSIFYEGLAPLRPSTVRIGVHDYRLEEVADLENDGGQKLHGQIKESPEVIYLDAAGSRVRKFTTTWHEVLHAIFTQGGMEDTAESILVLLENGIAQVLRDNPWLGVFPLEEVE